MIRKETSIDSVCHDMSDKDRMLGYKTFSTAFSYPDDSFFDFFVDLNLNRGKLVATYDKLFRAKEIWLYGSEYSAKHEFQRANYLSDIMGFYKAFGLEPDRDRPDSLQNECEFMCFLIYKELYALNADIIDNREEKILVCKDAQKKFFFEYLYEAGKKIAEKIIENSDKNFYTDKAEELLKFLEKEKISIGEG